MKLGAATCEGDELRKAVYSRTIRRWSRRLALCALALAGALRGIPALAADSTALVLSDTYETPYTTVAGDGFLDIIAGEAFRRAGLSVTFIRVPPERALLNANAGIEDGVSARIAGLEKTYPNLMPVPENVLSFHFVAFTQRAELVKADWQTISPLIVGHIRGWKIFEQNLTPHTRVTIVDTAEQLFDMLNRNRIDVALYERWLGLALAAKLNLGNVRIVEPPLAERPMFIYLHKRHANAIPKLADALRAIKAEGLYTRACKEKFAPLVGDTAQCQTN